MHQIQNNVLRTLLFKEKLKFSQVNLDKISHDQFNFHLKSLIKNGLVIKDLAGFYSLTKQGKEYANRLDTDSSKVQVERQAKVAVLVAAVRGSGKNKKYLVQQRLKQPFYGFYGFISGKIKWGETVFEAAQRELLEEANLKAKFEFCGIEHKMDYTPDGEILEDKYFYLCLAKRSQGELQNDFEGGKNVWLTRAQIKKLPNLFPDVFQTIKMIEQAKKPSFFEKKYIAKVY